MNVSPMERKTRYTLSLALKHAYLSLLDPGLPWRASRSCRAVDRDICIYKCVSYVHEQSNTCRVRSQTQVYRRQWWCDIKEIQLLLLVQAHPASPPRVTDRWRFCDGERGVMPRQDTFEDFSSVLRSDVAQPVKNNRSRSDTTNLGETNERTDHSPYGKTSTLAAYLHRQDNQQPNGKKKCINIIFGCAYCLRQQGPNRGDRDKLTT